MAQIDAVKESGPQKSNDKNPRKKLIMIALSVFLVLGLFMVLYWAIFLRHTESTDDAYVAGNLVQITPQVAGTITLISADNTDFVKAGSTLVQLDQTDTKLLFDKACAKLAQTVRQTRHLLIERTQLEANIALSQTELQKAKADLNRRQKLLKIDAVTKEELDHAKSAVKRAEASYQIALGQLRGNRALIKDQIVDKQPAVQEAANLVRESYLALQRTKIVSPTDGYLAQRNAQIGQRVNIGQNLMAVVPLNQVWVDANFKEVQLANLRIGQKAVLSADIYGGKVKYNGKVIGLGIGTGSAFSLLPPQNATGNWIKVVQRVPVRILLDEAELAKHPLRIGLSMVVDVDTSEQNGPVLAQTERKLPAYSTKVYQDDTKIADNIVQQIITDNAN